MRKCLFSMAMFAILNAFGITSASGQDFIVVIGDEISQQLADTVPTKATDLTTGQQSTVPGMYDGTFETKFRIRKVLFGNCDDEVVTIRQTLPVFGGSSLEKTHILKDYRHHMIMLLPESGGYRYNPGFGDYDVYETKHDEWVMGAYSGGFSYFHDTFNEYKQEVSLKEGEDIEKDLIGYGIIAHEYKELNPAPVEELYTVEGNWAVPKYAVKAEYISDYLLKSRFGLGSDDSGKQAVLRVLEAQKTVTKHDYVDMGLSVMWSTCNLGAEKSTDRGGYWAWGETSLKDNYAANNYKWSNQVNLTKYVIETPPFDPAIRDSTGEIVAFMLYDPWIPEKGTIDHKAVLDPADDAATALWGSQWRTPTKKEWQELLDNCDWEWNSRPDKLGYNVTSRINGNSIFLPVAGDYINNRLFGSGLPNDMEYSGNYMSSSINPRHNDANMMLNFRKSISGYSSLNLSGEQRCFGQSVRPVMTKP